jgi:hypothetical protein
MEVQFTRIVCKFYQYAGRIVAVQLVHLLATLVVAVATADANFWTYYFVFWSTTWPVFYVGITFYYGWRFRRPDWVCNHNISDNDADNNSNNVLKFRSTTKHTDN